VQIARDAASFGILHLKEPAGEPVQGLFGTFDFSNAFMCHGHSTLRADAEPGGAELKPALLAGTEARILDPKDVALPVRQRVQAGGDYAPWPASQRGLVADLQVLQPGDITGSAEAVLLCETSPRFIDREDLPLPVENRDMRRQGVKRGLKQHLRRLSLEHRHFALRDVGGEYRDALRYGIYVELLPVVGMQGKEGGLETCRGSLPERALKLVFHLAPREGGYHILEIAADQLPGRSTGASCRRCIAFEQTPIPVQRVLVLRHLAHQALEAMVGPAQFLFRALHRIDIGHRAEPPDGSAAVAENSAPAYDEPSVTAACRTQPAILFK